MQHNSLTGAACTKSAWESRLQERGRGRSRGAAGARAPVPRPAEKASRQSGARPRRRARLQLRGSGNREPRRGRPGRERRAPWRRGPSLSAAGRRPSPPRACLAPFADSGGSVPPSGGFSGLPLPAPYLPPVPAPYSCSDTPLLHAEPVPSRSPAERGHRVRRWLHRAFRRPRPLHRGARQGCGAGARREWGGGGADCSTARPPPRPRAARVLPGTPWSRRVPSGHKGARGTMGAASPWAPGARSGDPALRGGGRPSRRALSGQPPYASPPLLPPPTPAWMLQPLARPSAPEPPPPRGRLEPPRTYLGHEFCTLQSGPAPSWGATWGVGGARGWGVGAARGGPGRGGPGSCWGQRAGAVYFPLSLCVSVRCALA